PDVRRCQTFGELLELVGHAVGRISGIGELTIYDTALRIGGKLGLEPDVVYLHAGTREGARVFGLDGASVPLSKFPPAFRGLKPREVEDCLCIYKRDLARIVLRKLPK